MTSPAVPVCGVVLAAGEGRRLRPLTEAVPKALCPVGNLPLLDHALRRLAGAGLSGPEHVAVNAAYLADQVVAHVGARAHLSAEPDGPLGTSGGIGRLRGWIDGRGVLVGNADAYLTDPFREPGKDIAAMLDGWSGDTVRMLTLPCHPGDTGGFSGRRFAGFSLLPWRYVRELADVDSNLVRTVWRPAEAEGALELIGYDGYYLDTGTPADYLAANLHAAAHPHAADVAHPRNAGTYAHIGHAHPHTTDAHAHTGDAHPHTTDAHAPATDAHTHTAGTHAPATDAHPHTTGAHPHLAGANLIDPTAEVTGSVTDSVVGAGARVAGSITRCVIWPGAVVEPGEVLTGVIRATNGLTVPA